MFGIKRIEYYRDLNRVKHKQSIAEKVIELVQPIRSIMPRIGGKKLYHMLKLELKEIKVGREKLFDILRANQMLIQPKRRYHITTNSHHRFKKHSNLIKEIECSRPNEIWVSDITYVGKRDAPCYLALITDAYSKKVVGFDVSISLAVEGSLRALEMALKTVTNNQNEPLIHHSDRGLQYCSNDYQNLLESNNISPSMTEQYDPYENAIAERINGILKQEFDIDILGVDLKTRKELIENSIEIYNEKRPHWSNSLLTPNQMHQQKKQKIKSYKAKKVAI